MNRKYTLATGAILGFLSVALGAFGAHALKTILVESGKAETYELAVRYQFYHTFALLTTGILQHIFLIPVLRYASMLFLAGTVLFSGSLYALCFTGLTKVAMITPFGGIILLAGWALLFYCILKLKSHPGNQDGFR